ncbi:MAG: BamA/TamA family outer membrane protein [Coxiellaceae bacterium]|nr:BamA/TamA family outer membrane protein [Coxiellaceae bacterium]
MSLSILVFFALFFSTGFAASNHYIKIKYQFSAIKDPVVQKNVKDTLENLYNKLHFPLTDMEASHFVAKGPTEIKNAVTPYGFFQVKTSTKTSKNGNLWTVYFAIDLGPPLPVTAVHVVIEGDGKNDPKFIKLLKKLPLKVGEPLNTPDYDKVKTDLYNLATERGYFSAKMKKNQIQINLQTYQAKIILVFYTGPRSRFGETTFSKTTLKDSFLHRFITYKEGAYYDAKQLEKTQEGLTASTFFNQILIKPETHDIKNGIVPIKIHLMPRKRKQYIYGLGYGTDTGVRGTLGITLRSVNGDGHRFQTLIRASSSNSSAVIKYLIPGTDPARDLWTFAGGATHINQASGTAHNVKAAVEYAVNRDHWKHSVEFAYLDENYNMNGFPQTSTQLVYPTFTSKYIDADHPRNPHKGISLSTQFCAASKALLSETSFYQISAHFKSIYTITKTKTRLLFRGDVGHTEIGNIVNLPLSLQLLAGGSQSVRGYSYNGLGPGKNLVVSSAEVQERIYGDFYLAVFLDAGVVADNNIFSHINAGTGPGIVWVSPIGSLELTFAKAFTQPGDPWAIQFTMGTSL